MLIIPKSRRSVQIYLFNELHYRPIMTAHELQRSRDKIHLETLDFVYLPLLKINPTDWKCT